MALLWPALSGDASANNGPTPLVTMPETKTVKAAPEGINAYATLAMGWLVKSDQKGNYVPSFWWLQ